jgi:hypothetical protein
MYLTVDSLIAKFFLQAMMRFESQLKRDRMMAKNEIKMLLLGAERLVVLLCLCFEGKKLTLFSRPYSSK